MSPLLDYHRRWCSFTMWCVVSVRPCLACVSTLPCLYHTALWRCNRRVAVVGLVFQGWPAVPCMCAVGEG